MRILFIVQKGCSSYESIKTINGKALKTFQEACYELDREVIDVIEEASQHASGHQLRKLFVTLLMTNTMTSPFAV